MHTETVWTLIVAIEEHLHLGDMGKGRNFSSSAVSKPDISDVERNFLLILFCIQLNFEMHTEITFD